MMKRTLLLLAAILGITSLTAQNNSLLFDGNNDKVVIDSDPAYDFTDTFTIEAWIYAEEWRQSQWEGTIVAKDVDPNRGYVLRCGNNGTLSFTVGTGSAWNEVTSLPVMNTTTWYHVAAVLENGEQRIYINGSLAGSNGCPASMIGTADLQIGESTGFNGRVFDGRIDEVRLWNVARSEADIASNIDTDFSTGATGLVGYFKLDETSGVIASNTVAPGVMDGTLVNFGADPWQSGYEIPGLDMKADAVVSPDPLTFDQGAAQVKGRFLNNGLDSVFDFSVSYAYNGSDPVVENVTAALAPGESYIHTFDAVVVRTGGDDEIEIGVGLSDDSNSLNDILTQEIAALDAPMTVTIFDSEQHNFGFQGQNHFANVSLPEYNANYSQILMNVSVSCPFSGCDPWDQTGKISLFKEGETYELARFITPYGQGCGPWVVDVTSFKSLLQGDCEFLSYIQVWGASGWLLDVSLTYVEGETDYPHQQLSAIYDTDYHVYGEPTISHDLPTVTHPIATQSQAVDYRMVITGHGQANTDNAAEFSPKTHSVVVNGSEFQPHFLWKADCAQNDCANQAGTWEFNRAGWCPGQAVDPLIMDITAEAAPGSDVSLDYELEDYTNFLNTGYNGGSHTEPHYRVHAYLVEKSATNYYGADYANASATSIDTPVLNTDLSAATPVTVTLVNTGNTTFAFMNFKAYLDGELMLDEAIDFSMGILPGESYTHTFAGTLDMSATDQDHELTVFVSGSDDAAANDNVLHRSFDFTSSLEELEEVELSLMPNPSTGEVTLFVANMTDAARVSVSDMTGREVLRFETNPGQLKSGLRFTLDEAPGNYIVNIRSDKAQATERLVIE